MKAEDLYQVLYHLALTGLGAAAIKKGVDLFGFLYTILPGVPEGAKLPGKARAWLALAIAVVIPPAAYAVLLVDSGLVRFDFRGLVMVGASSFTGAWGWYQAQKYDGTRERSLEPTR
jgi:hypothetical protein